jgi:hypothetical protein
MVDILSKFIYSPSVPPRLVTARSTNSAAATLLSVIVSVRLAAAACLDVASERVAIINGLNSNELQIVGEVPECRVKFLVYPRVLSI